MYSSFSKELVSELVRSGFEGFSIKAETSLEKIPLVYAKIESPVFYLISLWEPSSLETQEYEIWLAQCISQLRDDLLEYGCQHMVCLSLLVDNIGEKEAVEYVHNKEFFPGEKINLIWWYLNPQKQTIIAGKGQPNKLLNIQDSIQKALKTYESHTENHFISMEQIEERAAYESLPIAKTTNTYITYTLLFLLIIIFAGMVASGQKEEWIAAFGVESVGVLEAGEVYRLFTALFLHGGVMHLLNNIIYLFFFGTRVELLYGKGDMLFLYIVSGLAGSLASLFFSGYLSIGASGAIFGMIGAVLSYSHSHGKKTIGLNYTALVLLVVVGLLTGFLDANVDVSAHVGGFFAGLLLSRLLLYWERSSNPHA